MEPLEFKSRKERRLEQEIAWADFDRELAEKIKGEFGMDPETKEVRKIEAKPKRKG